MCLLPSVGALDERAFVLDRSDAPIVPRMLGRLKVLLRQGIVVLVGSAETMGAGIFFVGERW